MELDPKRRVTLGSLSQSNVNARGMTSGAGRISNAGDSVPAKPRQSIAAAPRTSIGVTRRSSLSVSTGVSGRKSSLQPRSSSTTSSSRVDPRNISDKQFMNASIRTLINYLADHNYDHPISPKILTRPSNKDFNNIVLFLFKQIDPNLVMTGKFEDEVVSIFKQLGYPCQISKANISAAGTPHAWPSLLAGLVWLIELLNYDEQAAIGRDVDIQDLDQDADNGGAVDNYLLNKHFFSFLSHSYALFMSGEDDKFAELEEKFVNTYESKNILIKDQIHAIEQRNESFVTDIEAIEARRAKLPELESKKRDYLDQLGGIEVLVDQLQKHKEQVEAKTRARHTELKRLGEAIELTNDEVLVLKERVAGQDLSPEDVKQIIREREQLEGALAQASEHRQAQQRRVWELEMKLKDSVQALDDSAMHYNSVAEELKLVPATARNANGKHLAVEVDKHAKKRDDLLRTDVNAEILPTLHAIRLQLVEAVTQCRGHLIQVHEAEQDVDLKLSDAAAAKEAAELKFRRADEAYRREKDVLAQLTESTTKALDELETQLSRARDSTGDELRVAASMRRAAEAKAALEARRREHQAFKRATVEAIMDVVAQCASHREIVQERLSEVRDAYTQRLQGHLLGQGFGLGASEGVLGAAASIDSTAEPETDSRSCADSIGPISSVSQPSRPHPHNQTKHQYEHQHEQRAFADRESPIPPPRQKPRQQDDEAMTVAVGGGGSMGSAVPPMGTKIVSTQQQQAVRVSAKSQPVSSSSSTLVAERGSDRGSDHANVVTHRQQQQQQQQRQPHQQPHQQQHGRGGFDSGDVVSGRSHRPGPLSLHGHGHEHAVDMLPPTHRRAWHDEDEGEERRGRGAEWREVDHLAQQQRHQPQPQPQPNRQDRHMRGVGGGGERYDDDGHEAGSRTRTHSYSHEPARAHPHHVPAHEHGRGFGARVGLVGGRGTLDQDGDRDGDERVAFEAIVDDRDSEVAKMLGHMEAVISPIEGVREDGRGAPDYRDLMTGHVHPLDHPHAQLMTYSRGSGAHGNHRPLGGPTQTQRHNMHNMHMEMGVADDEMNLLDNADISRIAPDPDPLRVFYHRTAQQAAPHHHHHHGAGGVGGYSRGGGYAPATGDMGPLASRGAYNNLMDRFDLEVSALGDQTSILEM